jgi:uncharacterized protein YijF (DUF1287 family)
MIRSVGYDPQHLLLEIEFCSGKVYQYERVVGDVYREFLSANSKGIELQAACLMRPEQLEPYFTKWEAKWNLERRDINNPKIPLKFVIERGRKYSRQRLSQFQ